MDPRAESIIDRIHKDLKIKCSHVINSSRPCPKKNCFSIIVRISEVRKIITIPSNVIIAVIKYVTNYPKRYWCNKMCITDPTVLSLLIKMLQDVYETSGMPSDVLLEVGKHSSFDEIYTNIPIQPHSTEFVTTFVKECIQYSKCNRKLTNLFFKLAWTSESLCIAYECPDAFIHASLAILIKTLDSTIITPEIVTMVCKYLPMSKPTLNVLIQRGYVITSDNLMTVCKYGDEDCLNYITDVGRVPFTQEHFKTAVTDSHYLCRSNQQSYYKDFRVVPKFDYFPGTCKMEKLDVIFMSGYSPTIEDLKLMFQYQTEVPNLSRFSIDTTNELLHYCWDYDFEPNLNFKKEPLMKIAHELCEKRQLGSIRKHFAKHMLIPDRRCMELSTKARRNKTFAYLVSLGGQVTIRCMENSAPYAFTKDYDKANYKIVKDFVAYYKYEMYTYTHQIRELEEKVSCFPITIQRYENNNLFVPTVDYTKVLDIKYNKKNQSNPIFYTIAQMFETVYNNEKKMYEDKITELQHLIANSDLTDKSDIIIDHIIDQSVDTPLICDLPNLPFTYDKRIKQKVSKYEKLFGNCKRMTFQDLKRNFVTQIAKNKWLCESDKKYIDLPSNVRQELNLSDTGYIHAENIDQLVTLFYY